MSNDTTASSGVLFNTLVAPLASSQGTQLHSNNGSRPCPQVAGLVSVTNSAVLAANLPATITCPPNHWNRWIQPDRARDRFRIRRTT